MSNSIDGYGSSPSFERSINGVDNADQHQVNLPLSKNLRPVRVPYTVPHTQLLLRPESVHQNVLSVWLRPILIDPRITQPAKFANILRSASRKISANASPAGSANRKAVRLLSGLEQNREFVVHQVSRILGA